MLRQQLEEREAELAVLQEDVPELERENSNLEAQVWRLRGPLLRHGRIGGAEHGTAPLAPRSAALRDRLRHTAAVGVLAASLRLCCACNIVLPNSPLPLGHF